jgi:hypothetical protein
VSDTPRTDNQSGLLKTYLKPLNGDALYVDLDGTFVLSEFARFARQLERELNAANERIKRLEEAGDAMFIRSTRVGREIWTKAKEDKP